MAINPIKKLAGETVIYGLSSIIPRFINYLLVPFHTIVAFKQPAEYGVITELYTYATFLVVILTYGMETGFFKFSRSEKDNNIVFGTAFTSLIFTSLLFIVLTIVNSNSIANYLDYPGHSNYIIMFAIILGIDAISAIPFAGLRQKFKPWKFASIKIINVLVNLFFNLFFLWFCPKFQHLDIISSIYNPNYGVAYVFLANVIASITTLLLLISEITTYNYKFDTALLKRMLIYSLPLMVAGLAGNINEALDRILLRRLLPDTVDGLAQIGIYGANIKIAVLMVLFIQMFRYAAEPFFFAQSENKDSKELIAKVMNYFIIFCLLIFLGVTYCLDFIKYFVGDKYWEGLNVVPILLFAYLLLGVYYNISIWFKLNSMTYFGIIVAGIGALVTIVLNILYIPRFGYLASAWTHLVSYLCMVIITFLLGKKYYSIPYPVSRICKYVLIALLFYFIGVKLPIHINAISIILRFVLFVLFIGYICAKEIGMRTIYDYLIKLKWKN